VTANRNSRHQRALKGSLRHAAALVGLEDRRLSARRLHPLVNVRCGVLVDDYVHRRRKLHAAAEVIWVRVRIDDGRDRLVGQLADLVKDRLPPLRVFPVHDDHTRSGDKDSRVTYVVTSSFVTFRMLIELPLWSFAGQSRLAVVLWLSWVAPLAVTEFLLRAGSSEMPTHTYARSQSPP
jgi:hypothetical protein